MKNFINSWVFIFLILVTTGLLIFHLINYNSFEGESGSGYSFSFVFDLKFVAAIIILIGLQGFLVVKKFSRKTIK